MDEQMTAAQQSSYDVSADGLANTGYEEEPLQGVPEEPAHAESEKELAPRLYNEVCKRKKYRR